MGQKIGSGREFVGWSACRIEAKVTRDWPLVIYLPFYIVLLACFAPDRRVAIANDIGVFGKGDLAAKDQARHR
ncbi:uncharacterized protein MYCFIDRAFT_169060 [Pseudocercospora fijiensis CIRAD86]|uniref:Uncharacterized protein n=1 Tax=Pseudocercospora fijiensis (strain CIRAD86) TaxID=383855 RepID=N1Q8K3_PSEFD|nr:uncharacterized protein MYCFIDRAFT_169060 [Pseudocercospora fijiensis CIRAD86]EME87198.1 hypothetical protein MYCFIDRAFT_169060 [Pseudocercospora fijiensis CIRAD86]